MEFYKVDKSSQRSAKKKYTLQKKKEKSYLELSMEKRGLQARSKERYPAKIKLQTSNRANTRRESPNCSSGRQHKVSNSKSNMELSRQLTTTEDSHIVETNQLVEPIEDRHLMMHQEPVHTISN